MAPRLAALSAFIAVIALMGSMYLQGGYLSAQNNPPKSSMPDPKGAIRGFSENPWGGSSGFLTIPSARALGSQPRWSIGYEPAPPTQATADLSLVVIGLPVDLDHAMLQSNRVDTYCISRQSRGEQSLSLCAKNSPEFALTKSDDGLKSSTEFYPCKFTDDCWHSTAVSILAVGKRMDKRLFSIEAMAAVPFQDGTRNVQSHDGLKLENEDDPDAPPAKADKPGDDAVDYEALRRKYPYVPNLYLSAGDIRDLIVTPIFQTGVKRDGKTIALFKDRFPYEQLPPSAFPIVATYRRDVFYLGRIPSLVNNNMLLQSGLRPGGRLYAVNVFSRVEDQHLCAAVSRTAPCAITNLRAQEKALEAVLDLARTNAADPQTGRLRIGAVLIVAGGPLTDRTCENTPTARHIKALRQLGIPTFVPAGNDGEAFKVRFPACAPDAFTIGSLDRGGNVSAFSNGRLTSLVKLYTDGDTLVLPIRAPSSSKLACMSTEGLQSIVKEYQKVLAQLGYLSEPLDGNLDGRTEDAVRRFQQASPPLERTGKLDVPTLRALEHRARDLKDLNFYGRVSANLAIGGLQDLATYKNYLCLEGSSAPRYQAQLVTGTLVSTAVAAGLFLGLADKHPDVALPDLLAAVNAAASRSRVKEFDARAVNDYILSRPRQKP